MTAVKCGNCGGTILHEAGQPALEQMMICPRCASALSAAALEELTRGTMAGTGSGGSRLALDPYRTGTIVLEAECDDDTHPGVEVKVKGFLTQEGLAPDDADFRVRGEATVVGRREGQILVDDPSVSARHFQIEERETRFFLRDLGSSNGTFLNGRMVRTAWLQSGDQIQAGSTVFTFSVRHTIPT